MMFSGISQAKGKYNNIGEDLLTVSNARCGNFVVLRRIDDRHGRIRIWYSSRHKSDSQLAMTLMSVRT